MAKRMKPTRADENYIEMKSRFLAEGQRFLLVSVWGGASPDPRTATDLPFREGRFIVDSSGTLHGTTSNDELDEKIREQARVCLTMKKGEALTIDSVDLILEYVAPPPKLVIIGMGDVGLAIARAASGLDFKVILVDESEGERAMGADARGENVRKLESLQFDEATYIVVAHPLGYIRAMLYCLQKPWAYFGVLGSKAKIEELWKKLSALGVTDALRSSVHAPLGFDIGARTPEEIAIAALAEMIAVKNGMLPKVEPLQ